MLLTAICFHHTLDYGLTDVDTLMNLHEARVEGMDDIGRILGARLTGGRAGRTANFYRPTSMLGFAALRSVFGWEAGGYHVAALALHALCGALLAGLALNLARAVEHARPRLLAALAGGVFLIHPVAVEIVPAVARMPDLWATALGLAALLALVRGRETRGAASVALFTALTLAALGAKEPSVTLLPIGFALLAFLGAGLRWTTLALAPATLGTIAFLAVRARVLGDAVGGYGLESSLRQTAEVVANLMWVDLVLPGLGLQVQRVLPFFPNLALLDANIVAAGGVLVAVSAALLGWRALARRPESPTERLAGLACIGLLVHAGLFVATGTYDRRLLYTATVWFALAVACALDAVVGDAARPVRRAIVATGVAPLMALFLWQSPVFHRYDEWRSSGDAARMLTEELESEWRRLPDGAWVAIANLPAGFDLDPLRVTPYAEVSSTNSADIEALRAWLDEHFPDKDIRLHTLGVHRWLEPLAPFRHHARLRDGWLHFSVPRSATHLDTAFAATRGFSLRPAGPRRVALSYPKRPISPELYILVVDGEQPRFFPLRELRGDAP